MRVFTVHRVSAKNPVFNLFIQPEPETRRGLSLARNDAFDAIARSMLLTCTFVSHADHPANPFDPELLRSIWFRSRNRANSSFRTRCPRRSPPLL